MTNSISLLASAIDAVNTANREAETAKKKARTNAARFVRAWLGQLKTDFTIDVAGPKGTATCHVFGSGKARTARIKRAAERFVRSGAWTEDDLAARLGTSVYILGRRLVEHAPGGSCSCGTVLLAEERVDGRCRFCQDRDRQRECHMPVPVFPTLTDEERRERAADARTRCPICARGIQIPTEKLEAVSGIPAHMAVGRIKAVREITGLGLGESKDLVHCNAGHIPA